jgi:phosphoglucomutase
MHAVYIECKAETEESAKEGAEQVATDLTREWFRPAETGLLLP